MMMVFKLANGISKMLNLIEFPAKIIYGSLEASMTRWLDYFLNIVQFKTMKNCLVFERFGVNQRRKPFDNFNAAKLLNQNQ